jgi:hypothetical protein
VREVPVLGGGQASVASAGLHVVGQKMMAVGLVGSLGGTCDALVLTWTLSACLRFAGFVTYTRGSFICF